MDKTITQDQIVRFLYQEAGTEESGLIADAINTDFASQEIYTSMLETQLHLEAAKVSPPQYTVDRIMRYSRSTAATEHMH